MSGLDEDLVQRVDALGPVAWSGRAFRYVGAKRDPLSGAGARLNGGRWNPADIMSVIYLATPEAAAIGELERLATAMGSTPEAMTPGRYRFHTIAVDSLPVLDLRTQEALESVGLSLDDISDDDWTACQAVGEAASFLGIAGVLAPSASGAGFVLAAFETRAAAHLEVVDSEDFTLKLLTRLRTEPS